MYPEPLREKEIYKFKDMTLLLFKGNIYELALSSHNKDPEWRLMGSKDNYSLFLEEIADVEYKNKHNKPRPKEMRRVSF